MAEIQLSIKNVEEETFREFKAESAREQLPMGKALTQAMKLWIVQRHRKPTHSLLDYKPKNWGKGTEHTSEEIDKILYP